MKKVTIKGTDYSIRNLSEEVTLNELAKISSILEHDGKDFTEKWLQVLEILGSRELCEVMTSKQFVECIESVQITDVKQEVQPTIEIEGRTYSVNIEDGQIQLSAYDLSKIESLARKGGVWGNKAFAVVYKDDQLSNTEHYVDAHIKHKSELFGKYVTADIASPVIFQLGQMIVEHIERLVNAQGLSVQSDK